MRIIPTAVVALEARINSKVKSAAATRESDPSRLSSSEKLKSVSIPGWCRNDIPGECVSMVESP